MIHFVLIFSRQGIVRLERWFNSGTIKDRVTTKRELITKLLTRDQKACNFVEWKELRVVYRRYASLYFCFAIDLDDNELICLEQIHRYVEELDRYFCNVCEQDIIFNFDKALSILDELIAGGEWQESSRFEISTTMRQLDEKLSMDAAQENMWGF